MAKATMTVQQQLQSMQRKMEVQGGMINALTEKMADLKSDNSILTKSITAAGEFLTPELRVKINNMHNIEGDILTFNDRLQNIQEMVMPTEKVMEKLAELKKMFKRVNKTHGDIFKFKAEQEGVNELFDKRLAYSKERSDRFINEFSEKHNKLVKTLDQNPWLRATGWLNWERGFWILAGLWSSLILLKMVTYGI